MKRIILSVIVLVASSAYFGFVFGQQSIQKKIISGYTCVEKKMFEETKIFCGTNKIGIE